MFLKVPEELKNILKEPKHVLKEQNHARNKEPNHVR